MIFLAASDLVMTDHIIVSPTLSALAPALARDFYPSVATVDTQQPWSGEDIAQPRGRTPGKLQQQIVNIMCMSSVDAGKENNLSLGTQSIKSTTFSPDWDVSFLTFRLSLHHQNFSFT